MSALRSLVIAILALTFVGCGGRDDKNTAVQPTGNPSQKPTACTGTPTHSSIYGDWATEESDGMTLSFTFKENYMFLNVTAKVDGGKTVGYGTEIQAKTFPGEIVIPSTGRIVLKHPETKEVFAEIDDLGGTYLYKFEGNCLVVSTKGEDTYLLAK
jgi:hypothetical protein